MVPLASDSSSTQASSLPPDFPTKTVRKTKHLKTKARSRQMPPSALLGINFLIVLFFIFISSDITNLFCCCVQIETNILKFSNSKF